MFKQIHPIQALAWAILLVSIAPQAHAFSVGDSATLSSQPAECLLKLRNPQGTLVAICSGSLVSPEEVRTAKHCAMPLATGDMTMDIFCGFEGVDPGTFQTELTARKNAVRSTGVHFSETHHVKEILVDRDSPGNSNLYAKGDLARIILKEKSSLPFNKIRSSAEISSQFFDGFGRLNPGSSCKLTGFGVNPKGYAGELYEVPLDPQYLLLQRGQLAYMEESKVRDRKLAKQLTVLSKSQGDDEDKALSTFRSAYKLIQGRGILRAMNQPGDSGGSILCKLSEDKGWTWVAANSSLSWGAGKGKGRDPAWFAAVSNGATENQDTRYEILPIPSKDFRPIPVVDAVDPGKAEPLAAGAAW